MYLLCVIRAGHNTVELMEILSFEEYDVAQIGKLPPFSRHLAGLVKCWQQATQLHYMISL
jgi:hypothetical protein